MRSDAEIPPANGLRPGTAIHGKGQQRIAEILTAARDVLAFEGVQKFTMRNVASKAGTTLSNLQYYFPTKNALLREVLEHANRVYDEDYERLFSKVGDVPADRFYALIDYLLDDLEKPVVRGFFLQAWALAAHDDYSEQCMESTYGHYRSVVANMIGEVNPKLSQTERTKRAAAIQAIIEGSQLSRSKRGTRFVQIPGLRRLIKTETYRIASSRTQD